MHLGLLSPNKETEVSSLNIDNLTPSTDSSRTVENEAGINELAASIAESGVLQPLLVRRIDQEEPARYEIIAGHRRWRAASKAGLAQVPCIIHDTTPEQAFLLSLIENLQRDNLHPLDEAWAYDRLIERGIARNRSDIARLLGVSRARISQRMQLLDLDEQTKLKLIECSSTLTEYHARLLLQVKNLDARHHLAQVAGEQGMSGRALRDMIAALDDENDLRTWREKSGIDTFPRKYQVSIPGFHLAICFNQIDRRVVYEALKRAMNQLEEQMQ